MRVTVGIRSIHGMIRLSVARLRPQWVSHSLKGVPTLYGHRRNVHTGGLGYHFEVENTPLLRIVQNRASEFANLSSEVSNSEHVDGTSAQCIFHSCLEIHPRGMALCVLNG